MYVSDVFCAGQARDAGGGGKVRGVLGCRPREVEHFHMLVDIDCLSLVPSFTPSLHNDPLVFYICKVFDIKFLKVLRVLHVFGIF